MFDTLTKGFRNAKNRLAGLAELDDKNIETALREVRLSLLEADVDLGVVKSFLASVKQTALGQTVQVVAKHGDTKVKVTAEVEDGIGNSATVRKNLKAKGLS